MVAGARLVIVDLLLRALCLCEHYRARYGNVHAFLDRDTRRGSSHLRGGAFAGLLLESRRFADPLRNNACADLFRCRLHVATKLVVTRTDYIRRNNYYLERRWFYMVESTWALVKTMAGYSSTPLPKKLGIKEGSRVGLVNAPKNFRDELGELPDGVEFVKRLTDSLDIIIFFVLSERELAIDFARLAG